MSKKGVGIIFCVISALFFLTRYLAAALYGSNTITKGEQAFDSLLGYVGSELLIFSIVTIIIGIVYLVWAELSKEK